MRSLDLSFNSRLTNEHAEIYNKLAKSKVKIFNNELGKIYRGIDHRNYLNWVISNTSTRNPYSSRIYYYYLCNFFLRKILSKKKNNFDTLICDSEVQAKLFKKILKEKKKKLKVTIKIKNFKNYKVKFLKFFLRFIIIKFSKILDTKDFDSNKISLILTNIVDGYVKNNRYFPFLFEAIQKKKNIFFVPNIIIFNLSKFIKNLILLRREKRFIIKEDFISIKDLFSIREENRKLINIFKTKRKLKNTYIKELIKEELLNNRNSFTNLESFINFLFLKKLKFLNIDIKTSITWFENQPFERAWSYSLNKYYKNSKKIGYQGIVPADMYISQDHTLPEDRIFKFIPEEIYTIGNYFSKNIKKYDTKLATKTVSSLSFQHLFIKNTPINKRKNQILVTLPILENEINEMLIICKKLLNIKSKKIGIIIRPHPTHDVRKIRKKLLDLNIMDVRIDKSKNFHKILTQSKFFFGGMSSTCLEALVFNIPTVIYKSNHYINSSCIPNIVEKKYFLLTNQPKKIISFIQTKNINLNNLSNKLKKKCFKKLSKNILKEFKL